MVEDGNPVRQWDAPQRAVSSHYLAFLWVLWQRWLIAPLVRWHEVAAHNQSALAGKNQVVGPNPTGTLRGKVLRGTHRQRCRDSW
jgi:hypothetical protein